MSMNVNPSLTIYGVVYSSFSTYTIGILSRATSEAANSALASSGNANFNFLSFGSTAVSSSEAWRTMIEVVLLDRVAEAETIELTGHTEAGCSGS